MLYKIADFLIVFIDEYDETSAIISHFFLQIYFGKYIF